MLNTGRMMQSACWIFLFHLTLSAFSSAQDNAKPPEQIKPTSTEEEGDKGGLFFGKPPPDEQTRRYYIAAEPVMWSYAPEVSEAVCGAPLPASAESNKQSVAKMRYVRYTDETFTTRVMETPRLGILGPVLRGVVGDYLVVTFLNRCPVPLSMHPHGVRYDRDSEGTFIPPLPGKGAAVASGARFTYVWHLDAESGPLPQEPSSKGWLYHSHVAGEGEANLGLVGSIIVTDPTRARPDGTPADVDREMTALYLIFDESGLDAEAREAYEYVDGPDGIPVKSWAETMEMIEINSRFAINGRTFGNLQGMEMNEGERVRWYLFGLGSEQDFHTAHWHGMTVVEEGRRRTDVVDLLPATMKVADMHAKNPGSWLTHCHVAEHMLEGMFTRYTIHPRGTQGVSRSPAEAFPGTGEEALRSMVIRHLEAESGQLRIAGTATVYEAWSVFGQEIKLVLGEQKVVFKPDTMGVAKEGGASLHIRNIAETGVVHGGVLEFEIYLSGDGGALPPQLELHIGNARHEASLSEAPSAHGR